MPELSAVLDAFSPDYFKDPYPAFRRMREGDVMLFPQGDPHVMSSGEEIGIGAVRTTAASARYPETLGLGPLADRDTRLVCGFLGCDLQPYNPVLTSLPRQMHLTGVASGWLSEFPQQVIDREQLTGLRCKLFRQRGAAFAFHDAAPAGGFEVGRAVNVRRQHHV